MIQMNLIPEQRKAVISYPNNFKMAPTEVPVSTKADARLKYEKEVRRFVVDVLREWVMARSNSYSHVGKLCFSKRYAVDKILLMLINNKNESLLTICERIYEHGKWFVLLFPKVESRNYHYFKEVVSQVLLWCDWYRLNHVVFNANLFKN